MWWKLRPDILTAIAAAIRDHEQLRFDYRTHTGSEIRRAAEPHRLIHTGRHWYRQQNWRTFRVDRLRPRFPNGHRITPRDAPDVDLGRMVSHGVSAGPYRHQTRITLDVSASFTAIHTFACHARCSRFCVST